MVNVKEIENYLDYGKCVEISNGVISALVTIDIGPRIISFGFKGGQNFMCDERERLGFRTDKSYTDLFGDNKKWENLGGHRIWFSPESYPETYTPDDRPVKYEVTENGAKFIPLPDTEVGMSKTLEIKMDPDDTNMQVCMTAKNISNSDKDLSIWALSVCTEGGTLIVPMNTEDTGLLPNRSITVWPYTDLTDDRIFFGKKYATLRQDSTRTIPIKLGFDLNCGQAYYVLGDEILYKTYSVNKDASYPDNNSTFETYTNDCMLEFETLGELKTLKPNETSSHTEMWSICKKECDADFKDDESIDNLLSKI